jgi:hypothetical protein
MDDIESMCREMIRRDSPTFLENWPPALAVLSFRQVSVPLSRREAEAFSALFLARDGDPEDPVDDWFVPVLDGVRARLDDAVSAFPAGAFVRLGSRSPKDDWDIRSDGSAKVRDGAHAMRRLTGSLERIPDDIGVALKAGYSPTIFVREWADLPAWSEFRCFVDQAGVYAVSQYDYVDGAVHPEIAGRADEILERIALFVDKRVLPVLHVAPVVVDVAFRSGDVEDPVLVEINPAGRRTDPALYRDDEPLDRASVVSGSVPVFRYHGDSRACPFVRRSSDVETLPGMMFAGSLPGPSTGS